MEADPRGVFEVKFQIEADIVATVIHWMRGTLQPDPYGAGDHRDAYLVQSLYLDTPAFDVFHQRGSFGRAKFRIRRYGDGPVVFLERKLKRSGVVRKRRLPVQPADLGHLNDAINGASWPGAWFHHRLALRRLQPVVQMSYTRLARLGDTPEGRFRLTLDRELRATRAQSFSIPEPLAGVDLLGGRAVMEVKFVTALPAPVKSIVEQLRLGAGPLSKYRLGVRACGLVAGPVSPEDGGAEDAPVHA